MLRMANDIAVLVVGRYTQGEVMKIIIKLKS